MKASAGPEGQVSQAVPTASIGLFSMKQPSNMIVYVKATAAKCLQCLTHALLRHQGQSSTRRVSTLCILHLYDETRQLHPYIQIL